MGLLARYVAFPLDNNGTGTSGNQQQPFGCLRVTPLSDLNAESEFGQAPVPNSIIYELTNIGGASLDWTGSVSETWAELDTLSGALAPSESVLVVLSFNSEAESLSPQDDPYTATTSFENTTNDCGSVQLGISLVVVGAEFERFSGPFQYPARAFGSYFRTVTISGENRNRFSYFGNTPWNTECCVPASPSCPSSPDLAGKGVAAHQWSGSSELNLETSEYTGTLVDTILGRGAWPSSGFIYPSPTNLRIEAQSFTDLFSQMALSGAPFGGQYHDSSMNYQSRTYRERWYTSPNFPPGDPQGYFGGASGGSIWCLGYSAQAVFSNIITMDDLGYVPDTFGDPARTQHLTDYDPLTNTYEGTTSRAKISITPPVGATKVYVEYAYDVTPDDSSPPYTMTLNIEYDVTGGVPITIYEEFPKIVDATVVNTRVSVFYYPMILDDFEEVTRAIEYITIPPSSGWAFPCNFSVSVPNSEVWDNFESESANQFLYLFSNGYGFADLGNFTTTDPQQAFDSFEGYAPGEINVLYSGSGWVAYGWLVSFNVETAFDDFETNWGPGKENLYAPELQFSRSTSSKVTVPDIPDYHLGDFTIEAWVNVKGFSEYVPGTPSVFVGNNTIFSSNSAAWGSDNGITFYVDPQGNVNLRVPGMTPSTFIGAGINVFSYARTWVYLGITRSGGSYSHYVNTGSGLLLVNTSSNSSAVVSAPSDLIIGNDARVSLGYDINTAAAPFRNPFQGGLAEVRLWNFARTQDEIEETDTKRLTGAESGLVGYFPMNESSGASVIDLSSNGNDGSRDGGTTILDSEIEHLPMMVSAFSEPNKWAKIGSAVDFYFMKDYSGFYTTLDSVTAFDDFELETPGIITTLAFGTGWDADGIFTTTI